MVVAYHETSARKAPVEQHLNVSYAFITLLLRREQKTGSLAPKPASNEPVRLLPADDQARLVAYMGQHPNATLTELNQALRPYSERPVYYTCVWIVLKEHSLCRKKKFALQRA